MSAALKSMALVALLSLFAIGAQAVMTAEQLDYYKFGPNHKACVIDTCDMPYEIDNRDDMIAYMNNDDRCNLCPEQSMAVCPTCNKKTQRCMWSGYAFYCQAKNITPALEEALTTWRYGKWHGKCLKKVCNADIDLINTTAASLQYINDNAACQSCALLSHDKCTKCNHKTEFCKYSGDIFYCDPKSEDKHQN